MRRFDDKLWLLTPTEFADLPPGVRLQCIDGDIVTVGTDYIDQDTRFGCLAFGLTKELVEEQSLTNEFLVMLLKS